MDGSALRSSVIQMNERTAVLLSYLFSPEAIPMDRFCSVTSTVASHQNFTQ